MCLSTVYKNTVTPETVAMKNVMKIECQGDMVILTDLMERQMACLLYTSTSPRDA